MNLHTAFVNLRHRTDRLKHMTEQLKKAGIEAQRKEGIRTKDASWNRAPFQKMFRRTPGAIGCMLSQMEIMKDAYALGKHAFVMEDDLLFCDDMPVRLQMIDEFLTDRKWDVMWLGGTVHYPVPYWHSKGHVNLPECHCDLNRDAELTDHPNFLRSYGSFSTHCYIVNHDSIPGVIEGLERTMHTTIGVDYSLIRMAPKMHNYCFIPGCVIQIDNRSDIGNGMTIFSGFKKLGEHWFKERL